MAGKTVAFEGTAKVGRYPERSEVEFRFSGPILDEMLRRGISWVVPRNRESSTVLVTLAATFNPEAVNVCKVQLKRGARYAVVRVPIRLLDAQVVEELSKGTTWRKAHVYAEGDVQVRWEETGQ